LQKTRVGPIIEGRLDKKNRMENSQKNKVEPMAQLYPRTQANTATVGQPPAATKPVNEIHTATIRHDSMVEEPEAGHEIRAEEETTIQNVARPRGRGTGTTLAAEGAIAPRAS
jgi:hypothetical protein